MNHLRQAVGVCAFCGAGLCRSCITKTAGGQLACGRRCNKAMAQRLQSESHMSGELHTLARIQVPLVMASSAIFVTMGLTLLVDERELLN